MALKAVVRVKDGCRADWRATNGETVDGAAYVNVPSVFVSEMDDLAIFLEEDSGWTKNMGSVDSHIINMWGQYRGEPNTLKFSDLHNPLDDSKIRCKLLSSNIAGWYASWEGQGSWNWRPGGAQNTWCKFREEACWYWRGAWGVETAICFWRAFGRDDRRVYQMQGAVGPGEFEKAWFFQQS